MQSIWLSLWANRLKEINSLSVITGHVIEGHLPNITIEGLTWITPPLYNTVLLYHTLPTIYNRQINLKKKSKILRPNGTLLIILS